MLSDMVRAYERLDGEINKKDKDGDYVYSTEYRAKRQTELNLLKVDMAKYRIAETGEVMELDTVVIDKEKYDISETGTISPKVINIEENIVDNGVIEPK